MNNLSNIKLVLSCLFLSLFLSLNAQDSANSTIEFIINDFEKAKQTAISEEKLIVMKFSASWCMPCKLMDEHVWTNPSLGSVINENCVSISADYDHIDCYDVKQKYGVISLPTVLVLNACGDVLTRFDKSCSSTEILEKINTYNKEVNKICTIRKTVPLLSNELATVKSVTKKSIDIKVDVKKAPVTVKKEKVKTAAYYISKPVQHKRKPQPKYYLSSNPISRPHSGDFVALGLPMH